MNNDRFILILQETVGDSLVELWISYNQIEKLKGINVLKKLKVCVFNAKMLRNK